MELFPSQGGLATAVLKQQVEAAQLVCLHSHFWVPRGAVNCEERLVSQLGSSQEAAHCSLSTVKSR